MVVRKTCPGVAPVHIDVVVVVLASSALRSILVGAVVGSGVSMAAVSGTTSRPITLISDDAKLTLLDAAGKVYCGS